MSTPTAAPSDLLQRLVRRSLARFAQDGPGNWKEGDHPRAKNGQFGAGGGGSGAAPKLPPHLQRLVPKMEARAKITDVTPAGYGPGGGEREQKIAAMFSNSLGMSREKMPQIPNVLKGEFVKELEGKASIERAMVPADSLKPTQQDYVTENIEALAKQKLDPSNPIMVSSDGYVLDGHHRWAAAALNGDEISVLRVGMPMKELLATAEDFHHRNGIERRATGEEAKSQVRIDGESDKQFAKRVIDHRQAPKTLPEEHDRYFNTAGSKTVEMADLVSTKSDEENQQGSENGPKRMAAAYAGELSKRDPITVRPHPTLPGKFEITDGNGTYSSVKKYGWKSLPVRIESAPGAHDAVARRAMDAWAEADHPRADNGQFGAGGGKGNIAPLPTPRPVTTTAPTPAAGVQSFLSPDVYNKARQAIALHKRPEAPGRQLSAQEKETAAAQLAPALKAAAADKPGYDAAMQEIGKALGANVLLAPLKGGDRLLQKHIDENGGNPAEMKDLVRGSIIVQSLDDLPKAMETIRGKFDVARIKDRFAKPMDDSGYGDILLNVRLPSGIMGEIQVHVPEMLAAKNELGHDLYNVARVMPEGEQKAGLVALQKQIYGAARKAQEAATSKRLRPVASQSANSSRESGSPSSPALDGLPYTRVWPVFKSNAVQLPSSSTTTGIPSTSKNFALSGKDEASMGLIVRVAAAAIAGWNRGDPVRRAMDAWNEGDHPRGQGGQFGSGGSGGGAKPGPAKYHEAASFAETLSKNARTPEHHLTAAHAHNLAASHLESAEFEGKQAAGQRHREAVKHHQAQHARLTAHAKKQQSQEDARAAGQGYEDARAAGQHYEDQRAASQAHDSLARRALDAWK